MHFTVRYRIMRRTNHPTQQFEARRVSKPSTANRTPFTTTFSFR